TVNMPAVRASAGVDLNVDNLPGLHMLELGFLEIGGDPDLVKGNNRQQLLALLNVHSDYDILVYLAAGRRRDPGIPQIQFSLGEQCALLLNIGRGRESSSTR